VQNGLKIILLLAWCKSVHKDKEMICTFTYPVTLTQGRLIGWLWCCCSVTSLETHHYVAGQEITMRLMKKPRGSLRVLPAAADCVDTGYHFPPSVTGQLALTVHSTECSWFWQLICANVSQKQRKKMLFNVIILTFMSLWEGRAEVISMSLEIKAVCSLVALHRQTDVFRLVYWGTSFTVVYHNCGAANYYVIVIIMTPLHLNELELCETANFMSLLDGWL